MVPTSFLAVGAQRTALVLALSASAWLGACGGGGGEEGVSSTPPSVLALQATVPGDGASAVSRTTKVIGTFNLSIAAPASSDRAVTLRGPEGNPIAAVVTASGTQVTLAPKAGALPGDTTYTVEFTSALHDTGGKPLTRSTLSTFTTGPAAWQPTATVLASNTPEQSGTRLLGQYTPALAGGTQGDVLLSWQEVRGDQLVLLAARRTSPAGDWGTPVAVSEMPANAGSMNSVSAACGPDGDCYLAWQEWLSGGPAVPRVARNRAGTSTWEAPTTPPSMRDGGEIGWMSPTFDGAGNLVLLAWLSDMLQAVRLDAVTQAWGTPNVLPLIPNPHEARMVMDRDGNIAAAWIQTNDGGTAREIHVASYDVFRGLWSPEQTIDSPINYSPNGSFMLAMDGAGAATLVYARGAFGASRVHAARFEPITGTWGTPVRLDNVEQDRDDATEPRVVADDAGHVMVAWSQYYPGVHYARYSPVTGAWTAPQPLSLVPSATFSMTGIELVCDVAGNVTAVWSNDFGVRASRYLLKDVRWTEPADLSVPPAGSLTLTSRVWSSVADGSGNVTAAWYQGNTVNGTGRLELMSNTLK